MAWAMDALKQAISKLQHLRGLASATSTPLPLILDSLRLQRTPYTAALADGTAFSMKPAQGDWFTLYECNIRRDYLRHGIRLQAGDVVVDIGANFGAFAVLASRIVGDGGRVYAFEPNPETYRRLSENLRLNNCRNVVPINEAVGDADGEVEFFTSHKSAYASMFSEVDSNSLSRNARIRVKTRRFGSFLSNLDANIALLKVDCEGGEYALFDGMSGEEAERIAQVAMEMHRIPGRNPSELKARLEKFGFCVQQTYPLTAHRFGVVEPLVGNDVVL